MAKARGEKRPGTQVDRQAFADVVRNWMERQDPPWTTTEFARRLGEKPPSVRVWLSKNQWPIAVLGRACALTSLASNAEEAQSKYSLSLTRHLKTTPLRDQLLDLLVAGDCEPADLPPELFSEDDLRRLLACKLLQSVVGREVELLQNIPDARILVVWGVDVEKDEAPTESFQLIAEKLADPFFRVLINDFVGGDRANREVWLALRMRADRSIAQDQSKVEALEATFHAFLKARITSTLDSRIAGFSVDAHIIDEDDSFNEDAWIHLLPNGRRVGWYSHEHDILRLKFPQADETKDFRWRWTTLLFEMSARSLRGALQAANVKYDFANSKWAREAKKAVKLD